MSVKRGLRGPQIGLSRTHPNLVRKLFALEVPEIADGSVEIAALAREAGHRTKMAVHSTVPGLNAKGACIGPMGQRVRAVMAELQGEKIDIVDFSKDPAEFIAAALSPARVSAVEIVDPKLRAARVVVPDYQLSLAIGREGQNARLAAKLTGWRIDIRSDTEPAAAPAGGSPRHARGRVGGRLVRTDRTGLRPSGPVRTCIGCRGTDSRSALLRVVLGQGEHGPSVVPDPERRRPGRGAWLHPSVSCLDLAVRRRAFGRALRSSTGPDTTAVARWVEDLAQENRHREQENRKRV